jgi:ABC-type sugar transport system substrate-binding protein
VLVLDSHNDGSTQLANARTAITRGVKAIIISPTNSSTTPAVLSVAQAAHVPVVICFIGTTSGTYLSYITSTDKGGAYAAGRVLAQAMKARGWDKGPVGTVTIPLSRINGQLRAAGFKQAMAEANMPIAQSLQFQTDTILEDSHLVRDIMTAHPNIHGFFCQSDDCTLAAVAFLSQTHQLNSKVLVAGFDASPQTITNIRKKLVLAAAVQQPVLVGRISFQDAYNYLVHHKMPPSFRQVSTILVTTENVNTTAKKLIDNAYPK